MARFRVLVTPRAAEDIREAHAWYEREAPHLAGQWLAGIREAILGLETFPSSHALAPESEAFDVDVRHVLVGKGQPWRVFFTVDGDTVSVLHVRHRSRDYWRP